MKMSKVGNQTNSQDPQAVNSRVFVGNLNTFQCSKTDVERMFQRYGRLAGISMHKGYAFVQFTNPFDARSACLGEDGRTVLSQTLDVNMVAEPKPHQTGRKRQNMAKTGNDWDYYYDSYYASAGMFPVGPPRLVPPVKRPRLTSTTRSAKGSQKQPPLQLAQIEQIKIYSNPDILICGNCREMFTELQELLDHKKTYCKLRFTCKCHIYNEPVDKSKDEQSNNSSTSLLCVQCKDAFNNAWDLMVHAQAAHMVNIYELGITTTQTEKQGSACASPSSSVRENSPEKETIAKNGTVSDELDPAEEPKEEMLGSPASPGAQLDELMGAQRSILHALSVVSAPATQPAGSPPPLAATAPPSADWKPPTLLAPF